jgi:leucyl/phenylalanyl-tRNA--protein transferase
MDNTKLFWIKSNCWEEDFPSARDALTEPDGLLAAGGDLSVHRLLNAYRNGIFPWYDHPQPILWWSPDPRTILIPDEVHISRSLKKKLNQNVFKVTFDQAFAEVIETCSLPRKNEAGTWLTPEMIDAYILLHQQGHAHSIESWVDDQLVGGVYGVAIGQVFFGESMFSRITNASKVCLVQLASKLDEWQYKLIDCQVDSEHLQSMGAAQITRDEFISLLNQYCEQAPSSIAWQA